MVSNPADDCYMYNLPSQQGRQIIPVVVKGGVQHHSCLWPGQCLDCNYCRLQTHSAHGAHSIACGPQAGCEEAAVRDLFSRLRGSVRQVLARLQRGGVKHPLKASHVSYAAPRGPVQAAEQPPEVVSPEAKGQQLQQDLDRAHAARLASSERLAELQGSQSGIPSAGVGSTLDRDHRACKKPRFLAASSAASGHHRLCQTPCTS